MLEERDLSDEELYEHEYMEAELEFQVASIYAAEPRESSFTPSGRSSPLGDTCR